MRKTNCKETRRAVEAYVMDRVHDVLDRCDVRKPLRPVDSAFQIMRDEVKYQTENRDGHAVIGVGIAHKYREAGRVVTAAVANDPYNVWYLAACAGCFEAYYDAARDLLAEWLDQTSDEAARYDNDKVWSLYLHLTASAFARLHDNDITPHKIDTAYFIQQYEYLNGGHFFDRKTLKFFGQTRRSFNITAFHSVKDYNNVVHDCYRVFGRGNIDGYKFSSVHYFDRVTFEEITPANDNEEA